MDSVTLPREDLKAAHGYIEGTTENVTSEQNRWIPLGIANLLGA